MSNQTKYQTRKQSATLTVLPPSTSSSMPPLGQVIDLNIYKCRVTASTPPIDGEFLAGTQLTVHLVRLWLGDGSPPGWTMGFLASSQQSVQVDQIND